MSAEFAVLFLRPDGWWECGRGWADRAAAARDAEAQLAASVRWKVVPVGGIAHQRAERLRDSEHGRAERLEAALRRIADFPDLEWIDDADKALEQAKAIAREALDEAGR